LYEIGKAFLNVLWSLIFFFENFSLPSINRIVKSGYLFDSSRFFHLEFLLITFVIKNKRRFEMEDYPKNFQEREIVLLPYAISCGN